MFEALGKIVDLNTMYYKSDFDIDKGIIRRAAESTELRDKTLLWLSRPSGTHCLRESEAFIRETSAHNTWRFHAEQTKDHIIACVLEPKRIDGGTVYGDLFEINYREHAAMVAKTAVAPKCERQFFEDGFSGDTPLKDSYYFAAEHMPEHGKLIKTQTIPQNAENLQAILADQRNKRHRMKEADREAEPWYAGKASVRDKLKAEKREPPAKSAAVKTKGKELEL